jgi:hypothetical protein
VTFLLGGAGKVWKGWKCGRFETRISILFRLVLVFVDGVWSCWVVEGRIAMETTAERRQRFQMSDLVLQMARA